MGNMDGRKRGNLIVFFILSLFLFMIYGVMVEVGEVWHLIAWYFVISFVLLYQFNKTRIL